MSYILGITGHANIEKANNKEILKNGQTYDIEVYEKVYKEISNMVREICINKKLKKEDLIFVSGMARGVDEIFAIFALQNNLPLIASIPYSLEWHKNRGLTKGIRAQAIYYEKIISYIKDRQANGCKYSKIVEVPKFYNGKKYHFANFARNQNIIDESQGVISYLKYKSTGTNDAIKKAKESKKYLGNVKKIEGLENLNSKIKVRKNHENLNFHIEIKIEKSETNKIETENLKKISLKLKKIQKKEFLKEFYKIIKILEEKRKNNNLIVIKIETDLNLNNEDKLVEILEKNNIELNIFEKQLSSNDRLINKPIQ